MDAAGALRRAARVAVRPRRSRPGSAAKRILAAELAGAVRKGRQAPSDTRGLCRALCDAMSERRGGRPVELRFERFPDEIGVTGLWLEFADFDLVIVEERAEAVQQLVILGHELWHLYVGHRHHSLPDAVAVRALAEAPGLGDAALAVAARHGSREADEAEADDFGHRLATLFRPQAENAPPTPLDPLQRSLGYRGRGGAVR